MGMNLKTSGRWKTKWKKRLIPVQWLALFLHSKCEWIGLAMNGRGVSRVGWEVLHQHAGLRGVRTRLAWVR